MTTPGTEEWLALVQEDIIDPDLPIVDPHHHLWRGGRLGSYLADELLSDTAGHNVVKTLFMECHAEYRSEGPEHLKPLGETEFVLEQAAITRARGGTVIAGILGHADLQLGDGVREVLEGHIDLAGDMFRGIRHAGARVEDPTQYMIAGRAPAGLYADPGFRKGMRVLGDMGLTYDTWQYHYQLPSFNELAAAVPDTIMVLDHFSTPLGVAEFRGKQDEIFETWRDDMKELAKRDNVRLKLGGLAMPDNGFGWHERATPPTSDEFAEAQRAYYLHAIECFGVERCMMESNFPVDRLSISYHVLFNGLKKIVADFTQAEKERLFSGTAEAVYGV